MFTVTALAAPARADLSEAHLDPLRRDWQAGARRWLAKGVAAEFPVPARPADFDAHADALRAQGFDLAIQPMQGRRKALLLADMDSTMIGQECIDELAAEAGVGPRVADITARAMNGELNFHEALVERVGLLAGLPETVIGKVLDQRITLAPGGATLIATMRAQGAYTVLVSGGFTAFTGVIGQRLGFDEHRANTLLAEGGLLTGHVALPILGREAKLEALNEVSARLGITPAQAMAVGDGANDLAMIEAAGAGVALHAKPVVAAQAQIRIDHADLTALLYLQGYAADEFVRP